MKIPLIKPYITDEVKAEVLKVLDSGYLTEGPVTLELETAFRDYVGCRHTLAVTSCTTGLELALRAAGIGAGDEVIVPDYTYPATADVVNIVGATAVIVDVDPTTMLIDYDALEGVVTKKTKAAIPVSLFGNPLDSTRLAEIKQRHGLLIIEDAACSIGASYRGRMVGSLADISVFSLHPRKFITTGEGGIVTTADDAWARWMESYKHFGMASQDAREAISFDMIGTNAKLSNILAAVGVVQMRHVRELLKKRRSLVSHYVHLLRDCPGVSLPGTTPGGEHSYQSFCVFVEERDRVMKEMRGQGIEVQIGTYALHMHKAFNENPRCRIVGDMTGSRYAFEHCLALPMYHEMTEAEQQLVVENLITVLK